MAKYRQHDEQEFTKTQHYNLDKWRVVFDINFDAEGLLIIKCACNAANM